MNALATDLPVDAKFHAASDTGMAAPNPRLTQLLVGALALVVTVGLAYALRSPARIAELRIEAPLVHVTSAEIRAAVAPLLVDPIVALDLDAARTALENLPWVANARVERVWPAALRIRVWERTAFARWGDRQLVDTEARAFTPKASEFVTGLPRLAGSAGYERQVIDAWQAMAARLDGTPFALAGLARDARGEWTAQTRAGLELRFGPGAPESRLDLLLGPVARALNEQSPQAAHVDLRYTNGFAAGWKPRQPAADGADRAGQGEKHG